jgi:hypothetical protein
VWLFVQKMDGGLKISMTVKGLWQWSIYWRFKREDAFDLFLHKVKVEVCTRNLERRDRPKMAPISSFDFPSSLTSSYEKDIAYRPSCTHR